VAVYRQAYRPYDGPLTAQRWRFWILGRYALEQVMAWRQALAVFVACFLPVLVAGGLIYLRHNLAALTAFDIPTEELVTIDGDFFIGFLAIQSMLALVMAALVGPGLVSPDLTNGALPLYLSRPFTKADYVLGKLSALSVLLSLITWIPGLALVLLQAGLEPGWLGGNLRIAASVVAGAWAWILTVSLPALALSAWFRWRPVAGAMLLVVFFVTAGFGAVINEVMRVEWGGMLVLPRVFLGVLEGLFGVVGGGNYPLPVWSAWVSLVVVWTASLWLLSRKVRAYEVVR
jgi:ABC-2 type transport system permease protein